ncbi:DNA-directed RNA polymerase II [Histoplasma capsulatum var. duboisii H88]|uniref:Polymerase II polypeptide J n=3 Tax=Ajellomyces capsulatus TaxID=5037 RepID=C0NWN5_AJECG|nr:polymerase II polypeptide J [Histoplasma capsulatum G186AR]EEH04340.1 polymerase II polypeptide J [Histoplasma capsulatum G186AR]EER41963.1 DNA-directed RNA polymerase II [Histoplasma capsulatum H143]EGC43937.1 DNA-directed RNA polymerase II [Histoplasma capsulatum var. duboisii H88]
MENQQPTKPLDPERERSMTFFDSSAASYRQNPCKTKVRPHLDMVARFESFVLLPGEKKVEVEVDTRIPSTAIFTFNKEDHTLGNMIRSRLITSSHVLFSGYKVPHPLVPKFILRVQTDGQITPKEAVITACHELVKDLGSLSREFTKEYELRKMVGAGAQQQNAQNGV